MEFQVRKSFYCPQCKDISPTYRCETHQTGCGYLLARDPGGYEVIVTAPGEGDSAVHLECGGRVTLHKIKDAIFAHCQSCGLRVRVE